MDEARGNQDYNAELGILEPDEDEAILNVANWEDVMVEIILDSGACRHVMPRECAPGYPIHGASSSLRSLGYIVSSGDRVPNEGQSVFNLDADNCQGSQRPLTATFQVADLIRPRMSVSELCEQSLQ